MPKERIRCQMIKETYSADETREFAKELGKKAVPGSVYTLSGDLGTGKTAFAQGFAKGLDVKEDITSPTFTIMCVYEDGRLPFYHFDAYRLSDGSELEAIGAEEFFYGRGVCLIEWPQMIEGYVPETAVRIIIEKDITKGEDYRKITAEV